MKKLTLRIDQLAVESFPVMEREARGGTIHAHETRFDGTCMTQCATGMCDCAFTIDYSCDMPCTDQFPC
jgi:hypothetical protein